MFIAKFHILDLWKQAKSNEIIYEENNIGFFSEKQLEHERVNKIMGSFESSMKEPMT